MTGASKVLGRAVLVVLLVSGPALSQQPATDQAEALFREGRAALKRGEAATACEKFFQSQKLDPAPGTLLNLSECEETLGKLVDARRHLQEVLHQLPQHDDRVPIARERAASLDHRVPRLTVRLKPDAPQTTSVLLDRVVAVGVDLDIPVDPGRHLIIAKANGYRDTVTEVNLNEGDRVTVQVAPARQPMLLDVPRRPERRAVSTGQVGWIVGGVGVGGLATAGVIGLILRHKHSIVEEHCDSSRACDAEGLDAAESGRRLNPVYLGAWLVGAAGIATGASLIWVAPRKSPGSTGTVSVGLAGPGLSLRSVF